MTLIMVVDDDENLNWTICRMLGAQGYSAVSAYTAMDALRQLREKSIDMILLDYQLPEINGPKLCRMLRTAHDNPRIPVIFLTVRDDIDSKIAAFTAGGDDYLTKPFDSRELLLRVRAQLARRIGDESVVENSREQPSALELGPIALNLSAATVRSVTGVHALTPIELRLLRFLLEHPHQVHPVRRLMVEIWGAEQSGTYDSSTIRHHVRNLRRKLEPNPDAPAYLRTQGRHGYMLTLPNPG